MSERERERERERECPNNNKKRNLASENINRTREMRKT